jgi:hypothetical protein
VFPVRRPLKPKRPTTNAHRNSPEFSELLEHVKRQEEKEKPLAV